MNNSFDPKKDAQLEALIHKKLSQLKDLPAPSNLMPRVLAAIEAGAHVPWWHRSWSYWPRAIQFAVLPLLLGSAAVVIYALLLGWQYLAMSGTTQRLTENLAPIAAAGSVVVALVNALSIVGRVVLGQPVFLAGLVIIVMMYLACLGFGTVCFRVILNKR